MKRFILLMLIPLASILFLFSCEQLPGKGDTQQLLIGNWFCAEAKIEPLGNISADDQMLIAMINSMIKEMAKDMKVEFHEDGDYQMSFLDDQTLGKYDLRADDTLLTLKEEGASPTDKTVATIKNEEGKTYLLLEFRDEFMEDPNFAMMTSELDTEIKMVFRFEKE